MVVVIDDVVELALCIGIPTKINKPPNSVRCDLFPKKIRDELHSMNNREN